MSADRVEVLYSCQCGIKDRPVSVQPRRADEDIGHWVQTVCGVSIGVDHRRRSPLCTVTKMLNIKIPIPPGDDARIGDPV